MKSIEQYELFVVKIIDMPFIFMSQLVRKE